MNGEIYGSSSSQYVDADECSGWHISTVGYSTSPVLSAVGFYVRHIDKEQVPLHARTAYGGVAVLTPPSPNFTTRWEWVVSVTPPAALPPEASSIPTEVYSRGDQLYELWEPYFGR